MRRVFMPASITWYVSSGIIQGWWWWWRWNWRRPKRAQVLFLPKEKKMTKEHWLLSALPKKPSQNVYPWKKAFSFAAPKHKWCCHLRLFVLFLLPPPPSHPACIVGRERERKKAKTRPEQEERGGSWEKKRYNCTRCRSHSGSARRGFCSPIQLRKRERKNYGKCEWARTLFLSTSHLLYPGTTWHVFGIPPPPPPHTIDRSKREREKVLLSLLWGVSLT